MDRQVHQAVLAEIRQKKEALEAELESLMAVERWHAAQLNGHAEKEAKPAVNGTGKKSRTPKWAQCIQALRTIGEPARVPAIAKVLRPEEFLTPEAQRVFNNSLYNAMQRKGHLFRQPNKASSEWALVEWLEA